jgi:uncharacterized protein
MESINFFHSISGFLVGMLVGMTGVGGGSLMTPMLILVFGIGPEAAVGTDLLYASATKAIGTTVHGIARSIEWNIVSRLAMGSLPATVITIYGLTLLGPSSASARGLITIVLGVALFVTAAALVFRTWILRSYAQKMADIDPDTRTSATIATGFVLGVLVSISSVGAGAMGVTALFLLYPRLPMVRIVGSDIAHAVPLTLVAGIGHWFIGSVDWFLLGSLLLGSIPGIVLGSYLVMRIPEGVLRTLLSIVLTVVATRLFFA